MAKVDALMEYLISGSPVPRFVRALSVRPASAGPGEQPVKSRPVQLEVDEPVDPDVGEGTPGRGSRPRAPRGRTPAPRPARRRDAKSRLLVGSSSSSSGAGRRAAVPPASPGTARRRGRRRTGRRRPLRNRKRGEAGADLRSAPRRCAQRDVPVDGVVGSSTSSRWGAGHGRSATGRPGGGARGLARSVGPITRSGPVR